MTTALHLSLATRLLDPEDLGHSATPEIRDAARVVLGIAPVEHAMMNARERLRLTQVYALQLADAAARTEIESSCTSQRMGAYVWWDTTPDEGEPAEVQSMTIEAITYLRLRDLVISHPQRPELVRFVGRIEA